MAETTKTSATPTKVAKKEKRLKVTLVKSPIGYSKDQRQTKFI